MWLLTLTLGSYTHYLKYVAIYLRFGHIISTNNHFGICGNCSSTFTIQLIPLMSAHCIYIPCDTVHETKHMRRLAYPQTFYHD